MNSTQKAVHCSPVQVSLQKNAGYAATPDLPVFPPDLFWDHADDKEEDAAPGLYEHSFADFPHWVLSWIPSRCLNIHDNKKPYRQPYLAELAPEKYIFFRSIRV